MSKKKTHRGRIQAQGGKNDFEASESWAKNEGLSEEEGLELLKKLRNKIPQQEVESREQAFDKAQKFIKEAAKNGGIDSSIRNISFVEPGTKDTRVDIEVKSGIAFIAIALLIILVISLVL